MPVSDEFSFYVVDQMKDFGEVSLRKMFGGAGIFFQGLMFALIADDVVYLKTTPGSQEKFENEGMGPFYPFAGKRSMNYWELPPDVLENHEKLIKWCECAFQVAVDAKKPKGKKTKKKK